jgi:tRNA (cmo5U34)-methyltransferase
LSVNLWTSTTHALEYLARADTIPHRTEGESALLEFLPARVRRILDLGSGDGRLLALVKLARPDASAVALDFSPVMLERLRARFGADASVEIVAHDLDQPLPGSLQDVDVVTSSFAIHHLAHDRKRSLFEEVFDILVPGGAFLNLEHVASASRSLHQQFLGTMGVNEADEDPSNKLLDVETQLGWLREIGFVDVDCHWKWRELALLAGIKREG